MEKKVLKFLILCFGFIVLLPFFPEQLSLTNGFFTTSSYAACRCRCDEISQICVTNVYAKDYRPYEQCYRLFQHFPSNSKVCEPTDLTVTYRYGQILDDCGCYYNGNTYIPSSLNGSVLWYDFYYEEVKHSCEHTGGYVPPCN